MQLRARAMSGWIGGTLLAAVTATAALSGRIPFLAVVAVFGVAAAGELLQVARNQGAPAVPLLALAGTVSLFVVAYLAGERAPTFFPAVIAAALGVAYVATMLRRSRGAVTRGLAFTVLPIVVVGLLGAYAVAVRALPGGGRLVLMLVATTVVAERAGVLADRSWGRRRIVPTLPSDRTWEGAAAGAACSLLAAWILDLLLEPPLGVGSALILGALVAVAVPLAEATLSMLERDAAGGRSLRGRLLDRIDGVLVAAPVFFYAYRMLER